MRNDSSCRTTHSFHLENCCLHQSSVKSQDGAMLKDRGGRKKEERLSETSAWQKKIKPQLSGRLNDPWRHVKGFSADSQRSANTRCKRLSTNPTQNLGAHEAIERRIQTPAGSGSRRWEIGANLKLIMTCASRHWHERRYEDTLNACNFLWCPVWYNKRLTLSAQIFLFVYDRNRIILGLLSFNYV